MSTTNTAPAAPASTSKAVEALKEAAHAVLVHLEQAVGVDQAVELVEKLIQGAADGIVEGIEIASAALPAGAIIVSAEKLVLPYGEKKLVVGLDTLVEKLAAKVAPVPATAPADANATPAAQVNAL